MKPWSWLKLITTGLLLVICGLSLFVVRNNLVSIAGALILAFGIATLTVGVVRSLNNKLTKTVEVSEKGIWVVVWFNRIKATLKAIWDTYTT